MSYRECILKILKSVGIDPSKVIDVFGQTAYQELDEAIQKALDRIEEA